MKEHKKTTDKISREGFIRAPACFWPDPFHRLRFHHSSFALPPVPLQSIQVNQKRRQSGEG
jgi:hypothetical protein